MKKCFVCRQRQPSHDDPVCDHPACQSTWRVCCTSVDDGKTSLRHVSDISTLRTVRQYEARTRRRRSLLGAIDRQIRKAERALSTVAIAAIIALATSLLISGCSMPDPVCQPENNIHQYSHFWRPANEGMFKDHADAYRYEYRACLRCGKRQIRRIEEITSYKIENR